MKTLCKTLIIVLVAVLPLTGKEQRFAAGALLNGYIANNEPVILLISEFQFRVKSPLLLHSDFTFQTHLASSVQFTATMAPGLELLRSPRLSVPLWIGPSMSVNGLWGHNLIRFYPTLGSAVQVYVLPSLALGTSLQLGIINKSVRQLRFGTGIYARW